MAKLLNQTLTNRRASYRLHDEALEYVDQCDMERRTSSRPRLMSLSKSAMKAESAAAAMLDDDPDSGPWRSVLYRSAAWCAFYAHEYKEAMRLAEKGLKGNRKDRIADDADELLQVLCAAQVAEAADALKNAAEMVDGSLLEILDLRARYGRIATLYHRAREAEDFAGRLAAMTQGWIERTELPINDLQLEMPGLMIELARPEEYPTLCLNPCKGELDDDPFCGGEFATSGEIIAIIDDKRSLLGESHPLTNGWQYPLLVKFENIDDYVAIAQRDIEEYRTKDGKLVWWAYDAEQVWTKYIEDED